MRYNNFGLLLYAGAARQVAAYALSISSSAPPSDLVSCSTVWGSSSYASVETVTLSDVVTVTVTPTATTTDASTVTITSTAYADDVVSASTSTIFVSVTSTSTYVQESIDNVIVSSTVTVDTTYTSIYYVPTPAGFEPLEDTLSGYPAKKMKKRNSPCKPKQPASSSSLALSSGATPSKYPQEVVCQVVSGTASTAYVTESQSTVTVTVTPSASSIDLTVTITSTSTVFPDVTITESLSAEVTSVLTADKTSTVTATVTSTIDLAAETSYAVCAANNLISTIGGTNIGQLTLASSATLSFHTGYKSAYDCCALCVETSYCFGSAWLGEVEYCYIMVGTTCSSQSANSAGQVSTAATGDVFTVSNGECGYWSE
ncbi:hypothetical protein SEUCBS139899_007876 [Sporothrix eucalyptigena]